MRNKREHKRHAIVLILAVAGLVICMGPFSASSGRASAQAAAPSWSFTGGLNCARSGSATLLPNGKVLVAGGCTDSGGRDSAELYDPATGTWSYTGSLNANRDGYSTTLLQNGKVLVAGGYVVNGGFINTAELYDPATGTWSYTGSLNTGRARHTATLLQNGRVLVAGGVASDNYVTNSAELYDPATGAWSVTGALVAGDFTGRAYHTATLLQSGKVLVAGGQDSADFLVFHTELYDPTTGTWSFSGSLNEARNIHTATLLPNGNVLIAGACSAGIYCRSGASSAELYNPATGTLSVTGAMNTPRFAHTATLLRDGRVLIAGGYSASGNQVFLNSAEIYDPASGTWSTTANLNGPRLFHAATLLQNGKVLVVGGGDGSNNGPLLSAELYDSGSSSTINPIDGPQFFVRQHYLDFLGREPDAPGLAFWTNEITSCGADPNCIEVKRINVSAAFFLSIEFQETGYLVHRIYKVAYDNLPGKPVPIRREEFVPDSQAIAQGVEVGVGNWQQQLEANKTAFVNEFTNRPRFAAAFPAGMSAAEFVDTLNAHAGFALSQPERDALVSELASGAKTRAQVLRAVAEDADFAGGPEKNRAFVLAQYFGYLRRNPDDVGFDGQPDPNFIGYGFWLNKLNQFNGNYIEAEMVKAFTTSIEYRRRFGQ